MDRSRYGSRRWRLLRRRIFDRDGWRCQGMVSAKDRCSKAGRLECDHVLAVHKGGEFWEPSNLQALCRPCHFAKSARENSRRKHALMPAHRREWRNMVEDLLNKY